MKRKYFIEAIFIFSILLFSSCGNSLKPEREDVIPPSVDTSKGELPARLGIAVFIDSINISNINQYIHPVKGLWLIQSSGAMPGMENTSQVDKNFPVDFTTCKMESLPKIDCTSEAFWTKQGCFVQELNTFKDEKIWTYCGLENEDEKKVVELAQAISLTVINTSLSARYYFSFIEARWYLVFVDLRNPCEA